MKKILFGLILVVLLIIVGRTLSLGISDCSPISNHKSAISNRGMTSQQLFGQALQLLEQPASLNLSITSPESSSSWMNQHLMATSFVLESQKLKFNRGFHRFHGFSGMKEVKKNFCVFLCDSVAEGLFTKFIPKRE